MFDPRRDISSISHRDVSPVSPFAVLSSSLADEILSRYGAMPDWYYPGSPMTFLEEKEEEDAGKRLPGKKAEPAEININLELFLALSNPSLSPEEKEKILRIREIGAESVRVGERTILERAASLRREQFHRLTAPAIRQKRPAPYVPVTTVTSSLGKGNISRKKSPAMVFSEVIEKAQEAGVTFGGSHAGSVPVPVYITEFEKNNRPRDLWENPEAGKAATIKTIISESAEPLEESVIREPETGNVPENFLPGAEIIHKEEITAEAAGGNPVSSVNTKTILGKLAGNLSALFQRDASNRKPSAQLQSEKARSAETAFETGERSDEKNHPETKQSESVNASRKASAGNVSEEKILQESKMVENPAAGQKTAFMDRRKPAEEKIREAVNAAQRSTAVPGEANKPVRTDLLKREAAEETAQTAAAENIPTEKTFVERTNGETVLTGRTPEKNVSEEKISAEGVSGKAAFAENTAAGLPSEEKILLESEIAENSAAIRNGVNEGIASLLPGAEITYREETEKEAAGENPVSSVSAQSLLGKLTGSLTSLFQRDAASRKPSAQAGAASRTDAGSSAAAERSNEQTHPETKRPEPAIASQKTNGTGASVKQVGREETVTPAHGTSLPTSNKTSAGTVSEEKLRESVNAAQRSAAVPGATDKPGRADLLKREAAEETAQTAATENIPTGRVSREKTAVERTKEEQTERASGEAPSKEKTFAERIREEQAPAERTLREKALTGRTSGEIVPEEKTSQEKSSEEVAFAENTSAENGSFEKASGAKASAEKTPEEKILLESGIAENSAAIRNGADERIANLLPGAEITYREETEKEAAGEHPVSSVNAKGILGKLTGNLTSLFQRDAASRKTSAQAGAVSRTDAGSAAAADHLKERNRPETKRQEQVNASQKTNGTGASVKQVGREETVTPAHGTSLPALNKTSAGTVSEEKPRESVNVGQKTGMILPGKKAAEETAAIENIQTGRTSAEKTFVERTNGETVLTGRTPEKNVSEKKISAEEVSGGAASTEKTSAGPASEGPASEERILLESEMTENSAAGRNRTDEIAASLLPGAEITYRTEEANAAAAGENPSVPAGKVPAEEVIREVIHTAQKAGIGLPEQKVLQGTTFEGTTLSEKTSSEKVSPETALEEKILLESGIAENSAAIRNGADERIASLLPGAEITYRKENSPADKLSGEPLPEEKTPGEKIHLESELAEKPAVGRNKADEQITSLLPGAEITYRTGEEPGAVKATGAVPGAVQSTEKILGQLGREIASLSGKETGGVVPAQPQASISLLAGKLPAAVRNTAGMRYYRELSERRRPAGRVAPGTSYPSGAEGSFSEVTPGQEEPLYGEPLLWSGQEGSRMEPGSLYGAVSISYADPVGNITREIQNAMQSGLFPGSGQRGFVNPGNLGDDFDPFAIAENAAAGRSFAEEIREELSTQGPPVTYQNPFFMGMGTDITYREKPARENPAAAKSPASQQSVHISDAEIRRSADRIYSMIKDKIKLERRSMGLS